MQFQIWVLGGNLQNGGNAPLDGYQIYTGDTVNLMIRIIANGLVQLPLPSVTLTIADSRNFVPANTLIGPSAFTVNFDKGINILEGTLTLASTDTAAIALPSVNKQGRPFLDAFWEVQFVQDTPNIVRTWPTGDRGKLTFVGDINRVNTG
jgi:hypothetical protein